MLCPQCRHENPPGSSFCLECGGRLGLKCGSCGTDLPTESKFCNKCGTAVSSPGVVQSRFASPNTYTPRHLAEKILTSKSALEGERKQVTVLFADLQGSLELLADRDPEEARTLLDPVLERMIEAVHRYEGTVNQVMGDGIMALFGAPVAHEDHAVRACYAALRMQESIKRYAEEVHRTEGVPLHIRVGVNSGEVVVRSIRSDLHMDYTAVGQTTHLASRLEQMAMPGSILISPETLNLAEGFVVVKPLGERPVKGLDSPIEIFEIAGAGSARSRLQAAAARGLTRFVGRNAELEQLSQALERAGAGHGQIVAVVGEPGVGKSRLFWEFTHSHRTQGWLLVESSSVSYGKALSFLPLVDLMRTYFQIEARDDARKIREKVTGKLFSLDRTLEPSLPALLWLLDVPVEDVQWQRLDPPQRRQHALEGIKRMLLRESHVQPLLLVFEDLHWIDAETHALLDSVVESLPTARLLLLVNYRPEHQHSWGNKTYYRQLRVDPLAPERAEELLGGLLGDDAGLQPLKRLLIERTEGNPFFLEESVRTLVETKILAGERGAYRLVKATHALQIPATAQAILAARIDRLAPEDKRLLQAASVIGKDVPFTLLQGVAERSEESLRRGLASLQAAEFLYEARLFPDLEYTFRHALTHEVAYGSLLQERRRGLHAKIVGTIEALSANRLMEQVERLADHAFRGEVWEKAVSYLRQAGAKAFARSAYREAVDCYERAMVALHYLPETRETLEQAIDLRFDLRTSLWPLGELDRVVGYLREAETMAETLADQRRVGYASVYMEHFLWMTGHSGEARTCAQKAQAIADTLGDFPLQVGANLYAGADCLTSGDYRKAETFLRKVVQLLDGDQHRDRCGLAGFPAAMSRGYLAWALAEGGAFDEGITHGREGVRVAETLDHPYSWIVASWGPAHVHRIRGEFTHAVRLLERALTLGRDRNLLTLSPITGGFLGSLYVLSGRVDEGLSLLDEGQRKVTASFQTLMVMYLGEAYLLADRLEDALAFGDRALALARERGQRGYEAWALSHLGEIVSCCDRLDAETAEGHYREALGVAEELGMRPLVAHCHLGLGRVYRRTGKREQAQERLTTAATMYREMAMRFWLEQTEKETSELR